MQISNYFFDAINGKFLLKVMLQSFKLLLNVLSSLFFLNTVSIMCDLKNFFPSNNFLVKSGQKRKVYIVLHAKIIK